MQIENVIHKTFPLDICRAKVAAKNAIQNVLDAVENSQRYGVREEANKLNGLMHGLSPLFGKDLQDRLFTATNHCDNINQFDVRELRAVLDKIERRFPDGEILHCINERIVSLDGAYEDLQTWCDACEESFLEDWKHHHDMYLRYSDSRHYKPYAAAVKALNALAPLAGREPIVIRDKVSHALGRLKPRPAERWRA